MPITLFYAGLLAIVFLVLSIRVIQGRSGPNGASLGDGGDAGMQRRIRGHANFAEYVPLILILMALIEYAGTAAWLMHTLGIVLLVSRLAHGYTFAYTENFPAGRVAGTLGTLVVLLVAAVLAVVKGF